MTEIVIAFVPTVNVCATPLFALTVAAVSAFVPVIVICETPFATVTVYAVVSAANAGVSVPSLTVSAERFAFELPESYLGPRFYSLKLLVLIEREREQ